MEAISVSGSHRRYFRIQGGGVSVIGVIGTDVAENRAFIAIDRHFRARGINVPEVYAVSEDGLCYIQEDLGDSTLSKRFPTAAKPANTVRRRRICSSGPSHAFPRSSSKAAGDWTGASAIPRHPSTEG